MIDDDSNPLPRSLRGQSILTLTPAQRAAEAAELDHRAGKTVLIYDGLTGETRYVRASGGISRADRPRPK